MSDVSKLKINNVTYNIKDSLALRDAPTDGEEYVRKNGEWAISSGGGGSGCGNAQVMYYYQQPVNTATNAEIFRITNSKINTDTVVLECTFADPSYITSDVTWTSYNGYIAFTGTCTTATTANVTMAYKSDDIVTTVGLDLLYEGNPTANTNTSLITGKKFSDYKSLFIEADGGSINRFATAIAVSAFSASSSTNWWFGDPRMNGTNYYCLIQYASDTQFQIREKGSALNYFKIYGDSKYSTIEGNNLKKRDLIISGNTGDISADNFRDVDTGYSPLSASSSFIGTYGGSPFFRVANIWVDSSTNHIMCSILNTASTTKSFVSGHSIIIHEFY